MSTTRGFMLCTAAKAAATLIFAAGLAGAAHAAAGGPLPGETLSQSYRESQMDNYEYQLVEPFKVFDNIYYVGPGYVSVWLLTTSGGLILIDAAQEPYVDRVIENIRAVGFDPANIKYILISHGHLDHFGGVARIRELSGARVGAIEEDWRMIEAAGSRPGRNGAPPPRVPARDIVYHEGDRLTLGNTAIAMHNTPGHTPGVLSMEFLVYDGGTPHKAYYSGGAGGRGGVELMEKAVQSTASTITIADIEVTLLGHGWLAGNTFPGGSIFERAERLRNRRPGEPHPFVDPVAWRQWINTAHQRNIEMLEEARREAAAGAPAPN